MIILPIISFNTFSYHPSDNECTFAVDYCSEMFWHRSLLNYLPQYSVWWCYFTLFLTLSSYGSDWLSCKKIFSFGLVIYYWDFCTDLAALLPYREYKSLYSRQSAHIFSWHLCLSRTVSTYLFSWDVQFGISCHWTVFFCWALYFRCNLYRFLFYFTKTFFF